MRVPVEWLGQYVDLPADLSTEALAERLTMFDLKLEEIDTVGAELTGPLVVGKVLSFEAERHSNGKTVRWCQVDVGENQPRGIVCGADNFDVGDLIVASLPGATLPGGFEIAARKTYGHVSDGMICSTAELGLGGDPGGILVLDADAGKPGVDVITLLGLRADVLDLEINPDRGYALSMRGVARDAAISVNVAFHDPGDIVAETQGEAYPVRVDDAGACPVFVTRTVSGFDPSRPTPRWLARRIELAGMRPISLAVDITNYVMLELGQPIHGYDRAKLQGPIVVRRATAGEKVTTLDDVARTLTTDTLLITDDSGPLGLAGVMGGQSTELTASTTDIVIEAANFEAKLVARTARHFKLPSEASKRFERGVDPALPAAAATRVVELLVAHGGGTVEGGMTVVGTAPAQAPIAVPAGLAAKVIGTPIERPAVIDALTANGCTVDGVGDMLSVTPPTWRPDLTDPYDIVEEVLRVVGYDRVPSVIPTPPAGRGLTRAQSLRRRVGRTMAACGLVEVRTFPFAGQADWDKLGLGNDDPRRRQVMLENPLSAKEPGMVTTLLGGLLKTMALNVGRGHTEVAIFESAAVFLPRTEAAEAPILSVDHRPNDAQLAALDAALPVQPRHLGFALSGRREIAGWWGEGRAADWADAIDVISEVARAVGVEIKTRAAEHAPWHPGRCAAVLVAGEVIGHAGELHPRVAKTYGLPGRTAIAEIDLDALLAAAADVVAAPVFSTFPVAKEDVALVVDESVAAEDVAEALRGASALIESVRLFDLYHGEHVGPGKKSLAFALRMRAPDRTLDVAELATIREAALAAAAQATGAVLRS